MTFLPGQTLSAADLQNLGVTGTYTPALNVSEIDYGSGASRDGWYHVNGRCVDVWFHIRFGTGMWPGGGTYMLNYPPGYPPLSGAPEGAIGVCRILQSGVEERLAYVYMGASYMILQQPTGGAVTATSPWTWAVNDALAGHVTYLLDA